KGEQSLAGAVHVLIELRAKNRLEVRSTVRADYAQRVLLPGLRLEFPGELTRLEVHGVQFAVEGSKVGHAAGQSRRRKDDHARVQVESHLAGLDVQSAEDARNGG